MPSLDRSAQCLRTPPSEGGEPVSARRQAGSPSRTTADEPPRLSPRDCANGKATRTGKVPSAIVPSTTRREAATPRRRLGPGQDAGRRCRMAPRTFPGLSETSSNRRSGRPRTAHRHARRCHDPIPAPGPKPPEALRPDPRATTPANTGPGSPTSASRDRLPDDGWLLPPGYSLPHTDSVTFPFAAVPGPRPGRAPKTLVCNWLHWLRGTHGDHNPRLL